MTTVGSVAKTLARYLEATEGMSKDEFITTYAYSVLVEKSAIVSLENSSLLSVTKLLKDNRDVLHPITDSSELISNKTKVFELRKRSGSLVNDIFVGRAPTNDVVLANPSVSKSHLRFLSIPRAKNYQLVDLFSSNGTYLNGKKINPFDDEKRSGDVTVIRTSNIYAGAVSYIITLNGAEIFGIRSGQYTNFKLNEGEYEIGVKCFGGSGTTWRLDSLRCVIHIDRFNRLTRNSFL